MDHVGKQPAGAIPKPEVAQCPSIRASSLVSLLENQ